MRPGFWEIIIIIVVILIIFGGAKKIPEIMKGLGHGMKEFKKATREEGDQEKPDEGEKKG